MIKLLKNICFIIMISILSVVILNACFQSEIMVDPFATYDNPEIEEMPETIKYVNFGTSHGQRSFKYSVMGDDVYKQSFNFGTTSQSLVYDYMWASQFERHFNAEGGVAFLTVSYFTLYQDEMKDASFSSKNQRYYRHLDREHIREWNLKDAVFYGYIYEKLPILRYVDREIGNIFYFDNDWMPEELKEQQAAFDKQAVPEVVPDNVQALNKLIELLQKHEYRVILVTTPVQEQFREEYGKNFLEKFYKDINEIAEDNGIEYWNYEKLFDEKPELFIDTHHLSETGAEEFTKIVLEQIKH